VHNKGFAVGLKQKRTTKLVYAVCPSGEPTESVARLQILSSGFQANFFAVRQHTAVCTKRVL
jgi:hypothetical protein